MNLIDILFKTRSTGSKITQLSKILKIKNLPPILVFSLLQPSEIAFLFNSMWQNCKERPDRSTNHGDMDKIAMGPMNEGLSSSVISM